ncbi:hypothetical protein PSHT_15718 [Puccinia striiformis]|uniref:Uncharacterized protein n=3 Tax=Puccinia striiformis TaxID=27350 RepID=A0A2S4USU3_9BASI|nr:hypothetical protein PSHT_15718 [Puccinia striiformis]POW00281.1 hypothetical protein PSTT_13241 [Puccinia striiformis]
MARRGKLKHVGFSEMCAETIRRAHAVHQISAWLLDIELNAILSTYEELRILIVAYSPSSLGLLTGKVKSLDGLGTNDMRRHFGRFLPENFHHNMKLTEKIYIISQEEGCTSVQLAWAWIPNQSKCMIPIPGSTRSEGVQETLDVLKVKLSDQDVHEIRRFGDIAGIKG